MLKKIIIISLLISVYISNITTIVYSANQNEKIALASNLQDKKVLENLSKINIEDTQLIRKSFPKQYEKFISEYYQKNYRIIFNKNWNELAEQQKQFFFYIGVKSSLLEKVKSLNLETMDYLAEFLNNHGEQKIIQNSFELIMEILSYFVALDLKKEKTVIFIKDLKALFLNSEIMQESTYQELKNKILTVFINQKLDLNQGLLIAGNRRNINLVKFFLEQGANINDTNTNGKTPLINAVLLGNIDIVKLLLEYDGVDINLKSKGNGGYTALMFAFLFGRTDIVKLLLEYGADINIQNNTGGTILMSACEADSKDFVELLLKNGADMNAKDITGETALIIASEKGYIEIVKLFLKYGADINLKNNYGTTALMVASQKGYIEIVKLFLDKKAEINAKNNNGETALRIAAIFSLQIEIVKLLLQYKADINVADIYGETVLTLASGNGYTEVVKLLLENGADINAKDKIGETPLMIASENERLDTVKFLLERGAEINAKNNEGETPLMIASRYRHTETAKLLLQNKADINVADIYGNTALMIAGRFLDREIVELFLKYGADITPENLKKIKFSEIIKIITTEQNNRTVFTEDWTAENMTLEKQQEILQKLKQVLFINYRYENGETALQRAIHLGSVELINTILDNPNLDVNLENNTGHTAMSELLMSGLDKKDIVQIANRLLSLGAKIIEKSLIKNSNLFKNQGNISAVEIWPDSLEKTELLKLLRLQLLKEGKLAEYLKESVLEITEIITFLIKHDVINEITETLMQKLDLFMNKNDGIMAIGIDVNKLIKMRTMGV